MANDTDDDKRLKLAEERDFTVADTQSLSRACIDAKANAYCPYSDFRVGCAVLLSPESAVPSPQGLPKIVTGVNVENAAYPVGTCAERCAISTAVSQGMKYGDIKAIGIAADIDSFCSPCGMCRQFIREFCDGDIPIFMHNKEEAFVVQKLEDLLPMSFGPRQLKEVQSTATANGL